MAIFRQCPVQKVEFARQLIAHLRDKRPGILGEAKALIICISLRFEIGRQVIIGVAVAVGAIDPDFLRAHPLTQLRQDTKLKGDHIETAGRIDDALAPFGRD